MSNTANGNGGVKVQNVVSIVMLALFIGGAFWALAYQPINNALSDIKDSMRLYVAEAVFAEYKIQVGKDILRLERDIQKLESKASTIVGREEHQKDWDNNRTVIASLQRQIDDTNKSLSTIATPTDIIHTLQSRIDRLETELLHANKPEPPQASK